jgi:pyruvate-formate lyase-activating enzyme
MMERRRPLVADIKRNSLDDGPGIRSVVFFKGCPLRCVWCHNPECIRAEPEIMFRRDSCIGCKSCREICPEGAIGEAGSGAIDRNTCTLCGDCVAECPSGALSIIGRYYPPDELVETLVRDKAFYDNSGGGVTLSGGEPTLMMAYTAEVARKLKGHGIEVLVETCADFSWDWFAKELLPHVDRVYVDMKLESDELHKKLTGRGNARTTDRRGLHPGPAPRSPDSRSHRQHREPRGDRPVARGTWTQTPLLASVQSALGRQGPGTRKTSRIRARHVDERGGAHGSQEGIRQLRDRTRFLGAVSISVFSGDGFPDS